MKVKDFDVDTIFSNALAYIDLDNEIVFDKITPDDSFETYSVHIDSDVDITDDITTYTMDSISRAFGQSININTLKLLYNNVASRTCAKSSWLDKNNDIIGDIANALGDISLVNQQTNIYYPVKLFMQIQGNDNIWSKSEVKLENLITLERIEFFPITSLNTENFALISKNPKAIKMLYNIEKVEDLVTLKYKLELLNNEIHLIEGIC
jgi:hypothetical protein